MISQIYSFIQKHNLFTHSGTVILGLSGGPDSIFLLHLLAPLHHEKKIFLVAAHLDHEWRDNSAEDVLFCKKATEQLSIPFVHAKASEIRDDVKKHGSQEALGRKLRRIFLENVALHYNAQAIALGHHLQDQEETFFIRLIRGTTLTGLIGMRAKHGLYVRPLLETNKKDILTYLHDHDIAYLSDPTNMSESYLRNRIRLHVMPTLNQCDERFDRNFLRTLHNLQAAEHTLERKTHEIFQELTTIRDGSHVLDLIKFFNLDTYVQKRILIFWLILEQAPFTPTDRFLDEVIRFLEKKGSKKHTMHHAWELIKKQNHAYLQKR